MKKHLPLSVCKKVASKDIYFETMDYTDFIAWIASSVPRGTKKENIKIDFVILDHSKYDENDILVKSVVEAKIDLYIRK